MQFKGLKVAIVTAALNLFAVQNVQAGDNDVRAGSSDEAAASIVNAASGAATAAVANIQTPPANVPQKAAEVKLEGATPTYVPANRIIQFNPVQATAASQAWSNRSVTATVVGKTAESWPPQVAVYSSSPILGWSGPKRAANAKTAQSSVNTTPTVAEQTKLPVSPVPTGPTRNPASTLAARATSR